MASSIIVLFRMSVERLLCFAKQITASKAKPKRVLRTAFFAVELLLRGALISANWAGVFLPGINTIRVKLMSAKGAD